MLIQAARIMKPTNKQSAVIGCVVVVLRCVSLVCAVVAGVFCIRIDTMAVMNYLIKQTDLFTLWHKSLKDLRAKVAIARRIDRARTGNLGDAKPVGEGVSELRVDVGAGYRMYFTMRGGVMVVLLAGGDKSTQKADIKRAIELAKEV